MDVVQELLIHSCVLGAAARVYLCTERWPPRVQRETLVLGALLGMASELGAASVANGSSLFMTSWQGLFIALAGFLGGFPAIATCIGVVGIVAPLHSAPPGHAWAWQLLAAALVGVAGHLLFERLASWQRYGVISLLGYGLGFLPWCLTDQAAGDLPLTEALVTRPLCVALGLCVGYRAFHGLRHRASAQRESSHERSTQRALEQHALILENAIEGIALLSMAGAIIRMNPAFGELVGIPHDVLIGKSWLELAPLSERAALTEAFRHAQTDGRAVVECVVRDGEASFPVELTLVRDASVPGETAPLHLLARDLRERRATARFEYLALHDQLTGLPNRRALIDRLEDSLKTSPRRPANVAVLLFDIDRFKHINDTLGHAAGDAVLRHTASRMARAVRPTDTLARLGGDEFVLIARGINSLEQALALAERFRKEAAHPLHMDGMDISVELSTGVALAGKSPSTAAAVLEAADRAMYDSKARAHEQDTMEAQRPGAKPV